MCKGKNVKTAKSCSLSLPHPKENSCLAKPLDFNATM